MYLYQCPACDCLPVRFRRRPPATPQCVRCGRTMFRVSKVANGYRWALGLAGTGMAALVVADLTSHRRMEMEQFIKERTPLGTLAVGQAKDRARTLNSSDLLQQLEQGDQQWRVQEEILPDGSIRYLYKRRAGEADLTIPELRRLVASPPTFEREQQAILELLNILKETGVRVVLASPLKEGAAAEWDHQFRTLRIRPETPQKGSVDFLRILSHEAIHVAQSCKAGSLQARPQQLGLQASDPEALAKKLNDPLYANASQWERKLEMEAYGSQDNHGKTTQILKQECKV